jgi:hypothetical protein
VNGEGPSLLSRNLWAKHTRKFLVVLERALQLLTTEPVLARAEVELNRCLYFLLLRATRELHPVEEIAPSYECSNQPDPDDDARARREGKRPDFQWIYLDRYEPDPCRSSRQFVVECKRLGSAPRSDWVLNINYIEHGVWRFASPDWGYAKGASSAAMVGYWQDMAADDVLREVNDAAGKRGVSPLTLSQRGWQPHGVSRLNQRCNRSFTTSPLFIYHLWVDLCGPRKSGGGALGRM